MVHGARGRQGARCVRRWCVVRAVRVACVVGAWCVRAFRLACAHPRKGADGVGKGADLANWPPFAR
jgi:hypothetical protein